MSLHPLVKGSKKIGFESNGVSYDEYLTLRKKMKGKKLLAIHRAIEIVRMIKEEKEITYLKKALKLSLKGLNEVKKMIVEGVTERDIALELEYQLKKLSSSYLSFPPIVASGPNSSLPHAKPTKRKITATDVVVLDFGVRYNFYAADITRTILIGGNRKAHKIYSIVKEAHRKAIETVKVGIPFKKVDESARKVIEEEGLGEFFIHSTGHGIGLEVHEEPRVSKKNETKIEEGMVFTIEPGIYLPGWGGVRIEDVIVVREDGVEVISR
jgi:Xaa-Pro aminopeptidase